MQTIFIYLVCPFWNCRITQPKGALVSIFGKGPVGGGTVATEVGDLEASRDRDPKLKVSCHQSSVSERLQCSCCVVFA